MQQNSSNDEGCASDSLKIGSREHDTLKYHLLGPSLTKAGQDQVDQKKVSEIIYNASKGSKYFNNEEAKDRSLTQKIQKILSKKRQLEKVDLAHDLRRADDYIAELELSRDLSQTVIHIDCDAFYAAVEELDRPELKHIPMAVGKGVLTTCNYQARKYGCRSGMAGFVALKLCPRLVFVPLNFDKYIAKAKEIREILAHYDPRFESAGLDEAYLNITQYCQDKQMDPDDVVTQLRSEVAERTKITISAGIAGNAKIAKIASNKNKPNGQFRVANERSAIIAFMRDLPTRKVNGVGRVFERELDAVGIKTCGDIYAHRAYLSKLFGEKAFQFLIQCHLGIGRTRIQPAEEYARKSVGTESTFRDISGRAELRVKLRSISEELEKDLARTQVRGRTVVLKVKLHTYEVITRQTVPPKAVSTADELFNNSLPLMAKLEREIPGMKLRLMGLRCTNLVSTKKGNDSFFGSRYGDSFFGSRYGNKNESAARSISVGENERWEVWPEEEFEDAARQEREDEMNELEELTQDDMPIQENESSPNPPITLENKEIPWPCPICDHPQPPNDRDFNSHIDFCLSRKTIREVIDQDSPPIMAQRVSKRSNSGFSAKGLASGGHERGRGKRRGIERTSGNGKRQMILFGASD